MKFLRLVSKRLVCQASDLEPKQSSNTLVRLSLMGVALSVAVMLISIFVILGFKRQIGSFAYSQTGHISLWAAGESWTNTQSPIYLSPALQEVIQSAPGVERVEAIVQQSCLLKSEEGFLGLALYGLDSGTRSSYIEQNMREGYMPSFSDADSVASPIVLPSRVAELMQFGLGDKVKAYFLGERIQIRAYEIVGIYESSGLEKMPALCRASSLRRLSGWQDEEMYSRLLVFVKHPEQAHEYIETLQTHLERNSDLIGSTSLGFNTAEELLPELFGWLELIDSNVYVLLVLMLLVASFTMITGLIIVVLDKTRQIGILKALGASNTLLRQLFTSVAARLLLRALAWGNLIAIAICLIQQYAKPIRLDPANYFMDAVPVSIDPLIWLGINVGALLAILLAILLPTMIISRIKAAEVMRID